MDMHMHMHMYMHMYMGMRMDMDMLCIHGHVHAQVDAHVRVHGVVLQAAVFFTCALCDAVQVPDTIFWIGGTVSRGVRSKVYVRCVRAFVAQYFQLTIALILPGLCSS
jgi:hypothetical protein